PVAGQAKGKEGTRMLPAPPATSPSRHCFADCRGRAYGCSTGDGSACWRREYGSTCCPCANKSDDGKLPPGHRSGRATADYCIGPGEIRAPEVPNLGWFEREELSQ